MQSQLHLNPDGSVSTWTYIPIMARESLCLFIAEMESPIGLGESSFYEDHIRRLYC